MKTIKSSWLFLSFLLCMTSLNGQSKKRSFLIATQINLNQPTFDAIPEDIVLLPEFTWFINSQLAIGIHAIGFFDVSHRKNSNGSQFYNADAILDNGISLDYYKPIFNSSNWKLIWNFRCSLESEVRLNVVQKYLRFNGFQLSFNPAVQYSLNEKYALVATIGQIDYRQQFRWFDKNPSKRLSLNYGFDSIRLGFRYTFEKKKKKKINSSTSDKTE